MIKKLFISSLILLSMSSNAKTVTGMDIVSAQKPSVLLYDKGFTEGLVYGTLKTSNVLFCAPDGVTWGQINKVVLKYLDDNPSKLNEPFNILVIKAVSDSWPCTDK